MAIDEECDFLERKKGKPEWQNDIVEHEAQTESNIEGVHEEIRVLEVAEQAEIENDTGGQQPARQIALL